MLLVLGLSPLLTLWNSHRIWSLPPPVNGGISWATQVSPHNHCCTFDYRLANHMTLKVLYIFSETCLPGSHNEVVILSFQGVMSFIWNNYTQTSSIVPDTWTNPSQWMIQEAHRGQNRFFSVGKLSHLIPKCLCRMEKGRLTQYNIIHWFPF